MQYLFFTLVILHKFFILFQQKLGHSLIDFA